MILFVRAFLIYFLALFTVVHETLAFSTFSVRTNFVRKPTLNAPTPHRKTTSITTFLKNSNDDNSQSDASTSKPSNSQPMKAESSAASTMDLDVITARLSAEWNQFTDNVSIAYKYISMDPSSNSVSVEEIVTLCDAIDEEVLRLQSLSGSSESTKLLMDTLELRKKAYELGRYHLLTKMMKKDYSSYVTTASFLSPSRIDRLDLPNAQDIPLNDVMPSMASTNPTDDDLVDNCTLEDKKFNESILDKVLLNIFRNLVTQNTNGVTSDKPGIDGLLEQGRTFMIQPNQTAEAQHKMVKDTLGGLMTPVLPPFYRIFMSGIIPKLGIESLDGKQFGPWFYAPWLTTIVTPTFFGFLVGPSRPNRRKDGERGGLVVEKCKFLQESNCKGLCLHQCKIPAQQFFKEELGLDLTVSPNFATQECQWSFGEKPLEPSEDPSFPKGCIVGCGSRELMAGRKGDSIALSCN